MVNGLIRLEIRRLEMVKQGQTAPMTENRSIYGNTVRVCFVVLGFVIAALFLWNVAGFLLIFFCSILLALLLDVVAKRVTTIVPIPRGVALFSVALLLLASVGVGVALLGPSLTEQGSTLIGDLSSFAKTIEQKAMSIDAIEEQVDKRSIDMTTLLPGPGGVLGGITAVLGTTFGAIANLVLIFAFAIYLVLDPHTYVDGLLRLIPKRHRGRVRDVVDEMGVTLRHWLAGTALMMIVIGIASYVGLLLIGVPLALLLGFIAGVTAFVPMIGPAIAGGLMVLVALSESWQMALWALGLYISLQAVESYLLTPVIQSKAIDLPAVAVIAAQVLFGILFGVLGVALATPMAAVIAVAIRRFYIEDVLGDDSDRETTSEAA